MAPKWGLGGAHWQFWGNFGLANLGMLAHKMGRPWPGQWAMVFVGGPKAAMTPLFPALAVAKCHMLLVVEPPV